MADDQNKEQEQEKPDAEVKHCYACGLEFTGHGKTCSPSCKWEFYA